MRTTPTFVIFLVGYGLVVTGVGFAATAAGLSATWTAAIVLALAGFGVIGALSRTGKAVQTRT